jgi:hypothetical protein
VSLASEIVQLFGTSSVPVIVGGTVLGVFELGERLTSQRAKDALSRWLLTFDIQKAKALPDGTQELFERIFGERHFSLKCFVRSAAFSLGAMAFIALLMFLIYPKEFFKTFLLEPTVPIEPAFSRGSWVQVVLWIPWSILVDYVSLFKTRVILRLLTRSRRPAIVAVTILAIDYMVYVLIFVIGFLLLRVGVISITSLSGFGLLTSIQVFVPTLLTTLLRPSLIYEYWRLDLFPPYDISIFSIFFWAGFAPSIWMWLYVLALFVTRGLLRSEKLVNWLRLFFLDVEKAPFRSIGAVAAALAFIVSVAIILVSVEVSRISAAT